MPMRLLSQSEVKKASQKQVDRGREIDKHISEKTKELNEFKETYERKKKEILEDFVAYAESITGEKTKLEGRYASLEAKKGTAFKSLTDLSVKAEKRFEEAKAIEATFDVREGNLHAREEKVRETTKKNDTRENELNKIADKLSDDRTRLDDRERDLSIKEKKDAAIFEQRDKKATEKEKVIDDRLQELTLSIAANNKTAELLELREKNFEKYKSDQERLLRDKRDTLNRAWNELSTKHGKR